MVGAEEYEMSVRYFPGMDFWAYKGMKDREEDSERNRTSKKIQD